jgi:hypothetical protein
MYKVANFQNVAQEGQMKGATAADLANREDKDANASAIAAANVNLGMGLQQTGKDLNDSKKSQMLTNLTASLSKYGLKWDGTNIVKAED